MSDATLAPLDGHESRAGETDHAMLKLWLRLLSCTTDIESEIRRRMRERYGISLARFDYLAQLYRSAEGMKMTDLSRCLMVTGSNVTALTDDLEREGLVTRGRPTDRRTFIVCLTPLGRQGFESMAVAHERWILELFTPLDPGSAQQLYRLLGTLRRAPGRN